jgi:ribose transport system permease protein
MTVSCVAGIKLMLLFPDKPYIGILVMLLIGFGTGALNGLLVVFGKIDAFIATLGVQMILQGMALVITQRPLSPAPKFFRIIANRLFLKLPIVLWIGIAVFLLFTFILKCTRIGRYFYAVGENPVGALWSGLPANKVRFISFVVSSLMGVVTGLYMLGRSGAAEPVVDVNMALNSIAYALIGGGLLSGGKGSLLGAVLAALMITVLLNILNHLGINIFWQGITRGVVIVVILILYEYRKQKTLS